METLADIIGANIRRKRKAKGLSQVRLAEMAGVRSQCNVSLWEHGTFCPDAVALMQLSRVFGCTIDDLFKGAQLDAQ